MLPHALTNFEIQKYYQDKFKFNDVCSRMNLPDLNNGAYVINLDDYESIRTHQIALYVTFENVRYFAGFGVEHIPKEIRKIHWK